MPRCLVIFGERAKLGPYGVDKLQDLGYELVEVEPASNRAHRKLRDVIEHRSGYPIDKAVRSIPKVPGADVVLAFLERMALTPAWLKRHRIAPFSKKPLAMLACWLADDLRRLPPAERRALAAQYRGVDLTMVWSSNQLDILTDAGFEPDQVAAIPFGFAPGMFPLGAPDARDGSLAAIGSDRGRDYPTLLQAMEGIDATLDLYCKPDNLQGHHAPSNVRFHGTVPYDDYRALVGRVGAIAIPTLELAYPTGQTVALESAATGAALILTDTPAMRDYFTEETALMVKPGDVDGWRDALLTLAHDPELRMSMGARAAEHVRSRFTYLDMWRRVDELFRERGWLRYFKP